MAKITPAHLKPLSDAFAAALSADDISLEQALDFVEAVTNVALDRRVAEHDKKRRLPNPEKRGSTT